MSFILTTPLYYVNDKAHLGSTYTTLACDTLARFYRLEGRKVIFITGVDEHGQKIQRTAIKSGKTPQEHCDTITENYLNLWKNWDITYDRFIRTTSPKHKIIVEQFFKRVQSSGDIYIGYQKGWYCVECEEYKEVSTKDDKPSCSVHMKDLEWRDEENLFFRLSKYQSQIENLISQPNFLFPKSRRKEIINFVAGGLKDFSISRINVPWGIPVPGFKGHTFYVWFDALLGYLTAIIDDGGEINIERLNQSGWPETLHVIGKDILRFHAVYWPAMLISAGLKVPKTLFGHGFLTSEGQKMGKSLGNVLDPMKFLESYGQDSVRWYLLRNIHFGKDGDYQQKRFVELINNDLANTIGNMINRTTSMSRKWFSNSIPTYDKKLPNDNFLINKSTATINEVRDNLTGLKFLEASESILELSRIANVYINEKAPWKLIKDEDKKQEVGNIIYDVLEVSRIIGVLLKPILPNLSKKILNQLSIQDDISYWKDHLDWGKLKSGQLLPQPQPIIKKLEINGTL